MTHDDGRTRTRAAFTKFYKTLTTRAQNKADAAPRERVAAAEPGKRNVANRERHLRHLQEVLEREGVEWIGQMQTEHVDTAYRECVDSITPKIGVKAMPGTIKEVVHSFRTFITYHMKHGAIRATKYMLLLENLPDVQSYDRKMLIIPGEDWPEIFKLAHKRHIMDRVLIELCFFLAMRRSEALEVMWSDFSDDLSNAVFFRNKRNDEHSIPVAPELQETLREVRQWLTDTGMPPEPHWPVALARKYPGGGSKVQPHWTCKPGIRFSETRAREALKLALSEFGIKPEQMKCQAMHIARRSRACQLLHQGEDVATIAKTLGHKDYKSTMTYLRDAIGDKELREALSKPLRPTKELALSTSVNVDGPSNLPAVPQDKDALTKAALDMYTGGLLNKDEFQAMLMRLMN